jgi:NuA3 HAT complex component NTO1
MLAELVRKREKEKLRQVQLLRDVLVRGVLLPYHAELRRALDKVSS